MREPREHRTLPAETRNTGFIHEGEAEQLYGGRILETPIAAAREPDASHTAVAQKPLQRPAVELEPGERDVGGTFEKSRALRVLIAREERHEIGDDVGRAVTQAVEPARAFVGVELER